MLSSAGVYAVLILLPFHYDALAIAIVGILLQIDFVENNGIIRLDFAIEAQHGEALPPDAAIRHACLSPFRPFLMTARVGTPCHCCSAMAPVWGLANRLATL